MALVDGRMPVFILPSQSHDFTLLLLLLVVSLPPDLQSFVADFVLKHQRKQKFFIEYAQLSKYVFLD